MDYNQNTSKNSDAIPYHVSQQISPVSLGLYHSLAATFNPSNPSSKNVTVHAWGRNYHNMLGVGIEIPECSIPLVIPTFETKPVYQVSAGLYHSLVLVREPPFHFSAAANNAFRDEGTNQLNSVEPGLSGLKLDHTTQDVTKVTAGKIYSFGLGNNGRCGYPKIRESQDVGAFFSMDTKAQPLNNKELKRGVSDELAWFTPQPTRVRFANHDDIVFVTCGSHHSLAISTEGFLYSWGAGDFGQLGSNALHDEYLPVMVKFPVVSAFIVHCAAGSKHSLACSREGNVFAWGSGGNGRLGLGHTRDVAAPALVESIAHQKVSYVSAGESHSACLDRFGNVYTWGAGSFGKLGHGDEADFAVPRKIESFVGLPMIQVECGTFHTMSLSLDRKIFSWGSGLGLGFIEEGDTSIYSIPQSLRCLEPNILSIAVGPYHSAAVTSKGDILTWGLGGNNRLGHGNQQNQPKPKHIAELRCQADLRNINSVWGIQNRAAVVSNANKESAISSASPYTYQAYTGTKVVTVSCGTQHTALLTANGTIWVWGANQFGQLGLGPQIQEDQYYPVQLDKFAEPIRQVSCGSLHSLVVTIYGNVFSWGKNDFGQLGLGIKGNVFNPQNISTLRNALNIFAGEDFSACITGPIGTNQNIDALDYGELWMWGSAESGKLGIGEDYSSGVIMIPKKVEAPFPIWKCALGQSHVLALTALGDLLAWGAGFYGRLGTGNSNNAYVPAKVKQPAEVSFFEIAVGNYHSMAVSTSKDLWVWGRSDCVCSQQHQTEPILFQGIYSEEGLSRILHIAAASMHCFAIDSKGKLWAWGNNESHQLGCRQISKSYIEKPMLSDLSSTVQAVATSANASVAVLLNGDVLAWGCAKNGVLGLGRTERSYVQSPSRVTPAWVVASQNLGLPSSNHRSSNFNIKQLGLNDLENFLVHLSLQRSLNETSVKWETIQQFLFHEEYDNQTKQLEALEDDLVHLLGRHLDFLLDLKAKERPLHNLENQFNRQLSRVVRHTEHEVPQVSNFVNSKLASKSTELQELVWIFQQQPAYFLNLLENCREEHLMLDVFECVKSIYYDLEKSYICHLFACLLNTTAKVEIMKAIDINSLFIPGKSVFLQLFQIYALHDKCLALYGDAILNLDNAGSLVSLMKKMSETFAFYISPEELAEEQGYQTMNKMPAKERERLKNVFHASLSSLREFLLSAVAPLFANTFLPTMLRIVLNNIYTMIYGKEFFIDPSTLKYGLEVVFTIPLVKIILCAIVTPIFLNPDYFAEKCLYSRISNDESLVRNLKKVADFLQLFYTDQLDNLSSSYLLRTITEEFIVTMCSSVRNQMEVEDTLGAELALDVYVTHLDLKDSFVTIRSDNLAVLVNLSKQYESYLNLSAYDPVSKLVKQIEMNQALPFNDSDIQHCRSYPSWFSFKINRRFLLNEPNLVFCSITGAPVPQRLAPRQKAFYKNGQRMLSLLTRYIPTHKYDARFVLQECLRVAPILKSHNWRKLQKELRTIAESYTSLHVPDYEMAKIFENGAKSIDELSSQSPLQVQQWIISGILERQNHRKGLVSIQKRESEISQLERLYNYNLQNQFQELFCAVEQCENLSYETPISEYAKERGILLSLSQVMNRILKTAYTFTPEALPSATFDYADLEKLKVLQWLYPFIYEYTQTSRLLFVFAGTVAEGWKVQIQSVAQLRTTTLAQFEISEEKLLEMWRIPFEGCVTFHAILGSDVEYDEPIPIVTFYANPLVQLLNNLRF